MVSRGYQQNETEGRSHVESVFFCHLMQETRLTFKETPSLVFQKLMIYGKIMSCTSCERTKKSSCDNFWLSNFSIVDLHTMVDTWHFQSVSSLIYSGKSRKNPESQNSRLILNSVNSKCVCSQCWLLFCVDPHGFHLYAQLNAILWLLAVYVWI